MNSHAPANYNCPFCLIVRGVENEYVYTVASDIVFRTEHVTCFVASRQWPKNPGNTLIIPNQHYENIYSTPAAIIGLVHSSAARIAIAMKFAFNCEGVSTRQHNEPAGDQDVWHFHVHVTPRFTGDALYEGYAATGSTMPVPARAKLAQLLRAHLK